MAPLFKKMVIAGVGLIGGSLALAARERGLVEAIVGYGRSEENLRFALDKGIIDSYFHKPEEIPPGPDFLLLGTPVAATAPLTKQFLPFIQPGCIVSDVGSVKAACSATVISYISSVAVIASFGVPPTNWTMAGAAAIANPPIPAVSVIVLSPMSGLASASVNPEK